MSGILDLLSGPLGQQLISGVSQQTGQSADKTGSVLSMALPVLMGAMKRNASSPEGAQGLMNALSNKHDGGILENLSGLFGGGVDDSVMNDGAGILGHVLGGKQSQVQNALSQKSGIDAGSIGNILKVAAPILMGFLGQQSRQQNVSDANGLGSMLGGLMGGDSSGGKQQSLIESFLDSDGDGSILDDVAGMVLGGGNKKSGGLGGLLGEETVNISQEEKMAFAAKAGDTISISDPDTEYEIIIIEPGFNTWLQAIARPEGYYSQNFLETRNRLMVIEWNQRVIQPQRFNSNLYEMQINYEYGVDYGYDVNYKLYNYFIYFQRKYNQRLGPFLPRI